MSDALDAVARFGYLLREPVTVSFADGGTEQGLLVAVHGADIEVEHVDMTGGGHFWTATYTLEGDDETPPVVHVARYAPPLPGGYAQGELFA